jgi:hypothetical protein
VTGNDRKARPDLAVLDTIADEFTNSHERGLIYDALHDVVTGGSRRLLLAYSVIFAKWAKNSRVGYHKAMAEWRNEDWKPSRDYAAICHMRARFLALLARVIRREVRVRRL